jgi:hypothetical protein
MKQTEPPLCSSSIVMIGRNRRGNWVAQEQNGLYGGLFINYAEALRYALFENGRHPEAIVTTENVLELDLTGPATPLKLSPGRYAGDRLTAAGHHPSFR